MWPKNIEKQYQINARIFVINFQKNNESKDDRERERERERERAKEYT